jgi:hypothetical protein
VRAPISSARSRSAIALKTRLYRARALTRGRAIGVRDAAGLLEANDELSFQ